MLKILFLCTGNTCRSPMAEIMFNQQINPAHTQAVSAGLYTYSNLPATAEAILAMHEINLDLSSHRSRCISEELVAEADLILTMTENQKRYFLDLFPQKENVVYTLGEYVGQPEVEIIDPYQQGLETYRAVRQQLQTLLTKITTEEEKAHDGK